MQTMVSLSRRPPRGGILEIFLHHTAKGRFGSRQLLAIYCCCCTRGAPGTPEVPALPAAASMVAMLTTTRLKTASKRKFLMLGFDFMTLYITLLLRFLGLYLLMLYMLYGAQWLILSKT